MQFLGVGWQEIILIGVVAFFVLGPQRLPIVAYQVGKAVRTLQQYARAVRDEFSEEISYVEDQYRTIRGEVDLTREELLKEQRKLEAEFRAQTSAVESSLEDAKRSVEGATSNIVALPERTASAAPPAAPAPEPAPAVPSKTDGPPLVF